MAEEILLKDFPKADFESRMAAEFDTFLANQQDYFTAHPDERASLIASKAATIDDMYHVLHGEVLNNRVGRDEGIQIVWLGADIDPVHAIMSRERSVGNAQCVMAIIPCAIDAVTIVFQAVGVGVIARQLATRLVAGLEAVALIGLEVTMNAVTGATTALARAVAIAKLAGQILRLIGFKQIIQTLKDNLAWYQWALMGIIIVAQIVAWFASDGIALAAEIVILAGLIGVLVADVVHAISVCGTGSPQTALA